MTLDFDAATLEFSIVGSTPVVIPTSALTWEFPVITGY